MWDASCRQGRPASSGATDARRCDISGSTINSITALLGFGYLIVVAVLSMRKQRPMMPFSWEIPLGVGGFLMLGIGHGLGLFMSPKEMHMGNVGRIIYAHVPAAWIGMIAFLLAAIFALAFLFTNRRAWDSAMEAACEVGVLEGVLMLVTGAIFGRPTWGVWWTWDPRLTSAAVMTMSFVGVLLLRGIVRDPDRRATWSAIATILAGVNVPIVYMSVQWWASLHQTQSEGMKGSTIDPTMRWILYFNAMAFLFVTVWFMAQRWRIAERRAEAEMPEPLPEVAT